MPRSGSDTRAAIIAAAEELFYSGSLREVSLDRIAERAGVSKKTIYYHFRSKDELIAAYLDARNLPTLERYRRWAGREGPMAERVQRLFHRLAKAVATPGWRGCGFIRAAVELADLPGHPALEVARAHKRGFETWLRTELETEGYPDAGDLAATLMLLIDGASIRMLVQRDPGYAGVAAQLAGQLLAKRPEDGSQGT
ncbi:MAG: helix-turn-helix domain-containing protein [Pseudomonadota bacterium]